MSNSTAPNGNRNFSFVFKAKRRLENIETQKRARTIINVRKKWVAAAIIALASGSTVFLSQNAVEAATNDPDASDVQVKVVQQDQKQNQNTTANVVVSNSDSTKTQVNTTVQTQNSAVVSGDSTTANPKTSQASNVQNTSTTANSVDPNQEQQPANQADHVKGNVQSAWDQGYRGQGTVVAVIDSGADPTHKDFQTMPEDPKLSKDDMQAKISKQGYGKYVNEKFPYVYNYADRDNDYITSDDTNANDSPHGQHVSGIIAADGKPDGNKEYVVGVAPEAQLMQLRVFGQFSDEKTDDVARAIYDATNLGADVIQMSLGQGVADQQLTNIEQKAVQYAIDHGVFVSISASNNGNSASVDNPSKVQDSGYQSGSQAGNYEPLNSSTVANPGASKNALTVAAETSDTGDLSDMAYFSSWGPIQDFTLKPDLAAPGYQVVSTVNHDQYQTMSGTSMAGPFAAASAALVIQRLKQTNPELKGAQLVTAAKAMLMNTAKPQKQLGYTTPVSPRRQGAGQIDVGGATATPVYVTTDDGTSSVSLHQVNENTKFTLTFHNLTDQNQTYTFDDYGGGYTEQRDTTTGVFHDVQLAGARVNGENSFTLAPKEERKVSYSLDLTGLNKNQLVEGFLRFTNANNVSTVSVPYLAYYGDLTSENVFDQNANEEHPDIQGNRLVNEQNYPRGIADQESLKELVNVDGNYNWQEVAKLYESGKVAFSPNDNQKSDLLKPYVYLKQNVKDLKVEVLDAQGKVVRVVSDVQGVDKSYDENDVTKDTSLSVSMRDNPDAFEWDGKVYNSKTGKMETAKDGNYTYRLVATLWNKGPHQVQTADFPVVVDTVAPTLSNIKYDPASHTLSGEYQDTGAGFTNYSYATVTVNDKVFGYKLSDDESGFDNTEKTKGHFNFVLGQDALSALTTATNKMTVALSDVADNTSLATVDVAGDHDSETGVSIWNAVNGLAFDQKSPNYNSVTKTYILFGGANHDFYLNGKLVQVQNGKYQAPVSVDTTEFVFSTDPEGRHVLNSLSTVTAKAFFNWQKTDTFDGNFGVTIGSVKTNDPNDTVVQAVVTKGQNVKAYAMDYFTGEVYTGEVKDGIATFHVHTSVNQDNTTGVYKRALLTGWTEVDGPSFNDKQETSRGGVASSNHLGVYYFADAADRPIYTDRSALGVEAKDEVAKLDSFGPGFYPGHAPSDLTTRTDPNPDIHFDYMNDNDTTRFGQNAVTRGYYDPLTQKFMVTGKVDGNVASLTVLGDNSNENAPENQVKLGNDGKFSFTVTANRTGQRPIAYIYQTKDGQRVRGTLNLILDTVAPSLEVNQVNGDKLELWTNNPKFILSGKVNDNLDGYRLFVNGNNIYREFLNSGYNQVAGLNMDTEFTNPYGAHDFEEVENLNDNNDQPTTHVFTVYVVDQVGNKVKKKLTVHFDPNYVAPEEVSNTDTSNNSNTSGTVENLSSTTIEKSVTDVSTVQPKGETLTGKSFNLLHDAYIYNKDGQVVLSTDTNKTSLLKKGQRITALDNGKTVVINGVQYYRVGDNQFVKVANTVLQAGKRLQLKHNAHLYDKNGKVVKRNGKTILLRNGRWISALNNADKYVIKGKNFYKLANDQFVKVANTKLQKPKALKLTHNAFVYDKNGKRVKKSKVLKKGQTILAENNAEKFHIKGKFYYRVNGQFVKVANTL